MANQKISDLTTKNTFTGDNDFVAGIQGTLSTDNRKFGKQALLVQSFVIAASDETTDLTTGTAKITFRMPYSFTLTDIRASVTTAPVGSTIIVDVNATGVSILSTEITIDSGEKTSTTASTPPVISDTDLVDDEEMTIDIDQIGSSTAGTGLKVYFIGYIDDHES